MRKNLEAAKRTAMKAQKEAVKASKAGAGVSSGDQKKLRQLESDLTRTRNELADTKRKSQQELTRANDRARDAERREKDATNRGRGGGGGGLLGGSGTTHAHAHAYAYACAHLSRSTTSLPGGGKMEIENGRNRIRNLERELAGMRDAQRRADDNRMREQHNNDRDRDRNRGGDHREVDRLKKDLQNAEKENSDARRKVALAEADVKRAEDRIRNEAREKERLEQKIQALRRYEHQDGSNDRMKIQEAERQADRYRHELDQMRSRLNSVTGDLDREHGEKQRELDREKHEKRELERDHDNLKDCKADLVKSRKDLEECKRILDQVTRDRKELNTQLRAEMDEVQKMGLKRDTAERQLEDMTNQQLDVNNDLQAATDKVRVLTKERDAAYAKAEAQAPLVAEWKALKERSDTKSNILLAPELEQVSLFP